jgi:hypothetical protein
LDNTDRSNLNKSKLNNSKSPYLKIKEEDMSGNKSKIIYANQGWGIAETSINKSKNYSKVGKSLDKSVMTISKDSKMTNKSSNNNNPLINIGFDYKNLILIFILIFINNL